VTTSAGRVYGHAHAKRSRNRLQVSKYFSVFTRKPKTVQKTEDGNRFKLVETLGLF